MLKLNERFFYVEFNFFILIINVAATLE